MAARKCPPRAVQNMSAPVETVARAMAWDTLAGAMRCLGSESRHWVNMGAGLVRGLDLVEDVWKCGAGMQIDEDEMVFDGASVVGATSHEDLVEVEDLGQGRIAMAMRAKEVVETSTRQGLRPNSLFRCAVRCFKERRGARLCGAGVVSLPIASNAKNLLLPQLKPLTPRSGDWHVGKTNDGMIRARCSFPHTCQRVRPPCMF